MNEAELAYYSAATTWMRANMMMEAMNRGRLPRSSLRGAVRSGTTPNPRPNRLVEKILSVKNGGSKRLR